MEPYDGDHFGSDQPRDWGCLAFILMVLVVLGVVVWALTKIGG